MNVSLLYCVERNGDEAMKKDCERTKEKTANEEIAAEQQLIVNMIYEIQNIGTLEYIHTFIKLFLEKWG